MAKKVILEIKNGRLEVEKERELEEILEVIDKDITYFVDRGQLTNADLSKVFGSYFDIRLRRHSIEVIKVRTHYGGEMKRIAVAYKPYQQALEGYNHKIEKLDKFLRDNDYDIKKHEAEEEKKEEKDDEKKKKKGKK